MYQRGGARLFVRKKITSEATIARASGMMKIGVWPVAAEIGCTNEESERKRCCVSTRHQQHEEEKKKKKSAAFSYVPAQNHSTASLDQTLG